MTNRFYFIFLTFLMTLFSTTGFSFEKHKYPILKAAPPPCLFFVDEDTGELTGNASNPPCELGNITVHPGDTVNPRLRKQYGKIKKSAITAKKVVKFKAGRASVGGNN